MKQQTAVYFLEKQLINQGRILPEHFLKAKEMEKQQIEEAWENGYDHGACVNTDKDKYHGTQYYKENYEKH
jgi:hypothetical protein